MLLSDLPSDQEATGSNSNSHGGGIGSHVLRSAPFAPAASTLLPPPVQLQPDEPKARKKRSQPGSPDPEAEVIALSPRTLVATNRFVCEICNKGFQRDQNLQLHRRGHNLPWKLRQRSSPPPSSAKGEAPARKRVYVCPEPSCVHHDPASFHWILIMIELDHSRITIMDSRRKPVQTYQTFIDLLDRAFAQFRAKNRGAFKEKFEITTASQILSQSAGNNLCGYYVCEFLHTQTGAADRMLKGDKGVPQYLAEQGSELSPARVRAIQEQLVGFIYDEVVNPKGEFHEPNFNRWGPSIRTGELSFSTSTASKSDARKKSQ